MRPNKDDLSTERDDSIEKQSILKILKRKLVKFLKELLRPEERPRSIREVLWPSSPSLFVKITNVIIIGMIIAAFYAKTAKADTVALNPKYSDILGKINNNNVAFFWDEPKYPEILQLPDELLASFVRKRKPTFVKFDVDLLFYKMAKDEKFTYTFYVDFEYMSKNFRQCVVAKDNNEDLKLAKICRNKLLICLGKKDVSEVDASDLSGCLDKNKECESMKKLDTGKVIPIEYCEKLYGRKL